ncbi:MAG: DUF4199 domain-containing protein [Bacteroidota bacterium]
MKKITLIFGSVIGLVLTTNSIIHMSMMYSNPNYKGNDVIGYATMVIIFSVIYFGVRNYRNKRLDGKMGFPKAFKTGALICFIASSYYVVFGLLYYYLFVPDFMDVYAEYIIRNSPGSEVEAKTAQMASFKEMSKNPLFLVLFSYFEVLPIGMIVALISAFIVKRK